MFAHLSSDLGLALCVCLRAEMGLGQLASSLARSARFLRYSPSNAHRPSFSPVLSLRVGKTVQSISFLSYLAGQKGIWGPFLVVAPNSTLHQWQQEVTRFAPDLKVLPYWGAAKERQILRSFWTSKQLYTKDAPFHVLITSYNAVVADEKYFHRLKFMYMILDEAQAIKNASSLRWKSLLGLKCRNRVLLTGTPIQNSMDELWALLHFIMGELFDSKAEFSEWFSKDVENSTIQSGVGLDQRQLQRLHMILKPFMLRRVKKDVENEMPPKIEITVPCSLSLTQKRIYKQLQKKILIANQEALLPPSKRAFLTSLSGPATSFTAADKSASDNLVTLVMQFRKVRDGTQYNQQAQRQKRAVAVAMAMAADAAADVSVSVVVGL